MSIRKHFKHFRGKLKDGFQSLGRSMRSTSDLPGFEADPTPLNPRAQSHSPTPVPGARPPSSRNGHQVDSGGDVAEEIRPLKNIQAGTHSVDPISRPSDRQDDRVQLTASPIDLTGTSSIASPDPMPNFSISKSYPLPSPAPTSIGDAQSDHPQVFSPVPTVQTPLLGTKDVSALSSVGERDQETPSHAPPSARAILANSTPTFNLRVEDEDITGQPTHPRLANPISVSTSSLLGQQSTVSAIAAASELELVPPIQPTSTSITVGSTLATNTWKHFNRFLDILGGIAKDAGPLKAVMGELGGVISMYEDEVEARSDYKALRTQLEGLFGVLATRLSGSPPLSMAKPLNDLCTAIRSELEKISSKEKRGLGGRYLEANKDIEEVMACYRRIQGHLEQFKLEANMNVWEIADRQAVEHMLRTLAPSTSAWYNSAEALQVGRRECTPKTREKILEDLHRWTNDKQPENMFWLNGMAGTGKTTIASSLCKMLERSAKLGASFFCTRLLPECRNVKLILPTTAYQLARCSPEFCNALSAAMKRDPDLHLKALPVQLEGLIVGPLREAQLQRDLVVVIDALDECEDGQEVDLLLEILANRAPDLPLKVFVSSRPEPQIRQRIGDIESKIILHDLEASIVKEDIKLYLQTELEDLSTSISDKDLVNLVDRAGVLFIYAATVVRYIKSATLTTRRQKRMQAVLNMDVSGMSNTNNEIDALYGAILSSAFNNPDLVDDEIAIMKLVLDTIVCAQEPLTVKALAGLLGVEASVIFEAIEPLWSVLHISGGEYLVTSLHASFPDYMLDPTRSHVQVCVQEIHHGRLAELCFDRIDRNQTQFNICGLESSDVFDEDVEGLDERVNCNIPQDLFYACRYWAAHVKLGGLSTNRVQRIHSFFSNRLLLWMEVLNLKKQLSASNSIMQTIRLWCEDGDITRETKDLVHNAWRFVTMFATNDISRSTAHLYTSMLASWPSSGSFISSFRRRSRGLCRVGGTAMKRRQLSVLGVLNANRAITSIGLSPSGTRIISGSNDNTIRVWDAETGQLLFDPLTGHRASVNSVAFSPDGMHIVSGSHDKTIRVWDAQTGRPKLGPFRGHASWVLSVAFSPNGMRIVSGSEDSTLRVWDVETGKSLFEPLVGHTDSVNSVAFSPNGMRIVSGSHDKTIRVWDAQTGRPRLDSFRGHASWVFSVSFSPNSMRIVSGSEDCTIRVWDAETGKSLLGPLKGHALSVNSVALSPDGMHIVSGSDDKTIRMWDAQTGKSLLDSFTGHTTSVNSVAFSPDGMRVISGSNDRTIRLWDAQASKSLLSSLKSHISSVRSVAFSPDGMRIVSSSNDGTIRVWDAQTGGSLLDPFTGHTSSVTSVAFSPNGMRIVSGSDDKTIRVWDAQTGKSLLNWLKEHTSSVNSVAFSPDGMRIVSGSDDNTIRVWDARTGNPLLESLKGHTKSVRSVAFSPDGERIVSGSIDDTIRVWDAQTGRSLLDPLKGHTITVNSVAFSPDGTRIVSGSSDSTIRVWDAQTGKSLLDPLKGHTKSVSSVTFSPDGMRIVSGSDDNTIRVWDAQTGKSLLDPLEGHPHSVNSVAISPDGKRIVSGSLDGTIRVWYSPGSIIQPESSLWVLDDHGWVRDAHQRPLLWLPPDLRDRLILPNMVCMISTEGSVELNFENAKLGEEWVDCYAPCPPT